MAGSTTSFGYVGGIVDYTVPATGYYYITAYGAQGGNGTSLNSTDSGGLGAEVSGWVTVTQGQVLEIGVGQAGGASANGPASGGGGTFVVNKEEGSPVMIAGGGGGGDNFAPGGAGQVGTAGQTIAGGAAGGTNGSGGLTPVSQGPTLSGGTANTEYGGGGGGGFLTNGQGNSIIPGIGYAYGSGFGGRSFANGLIAVGRYGFQSVFGGGGGAGMYGGGGGGGYSGGGGSSNGEPGGGGGSLDTGTFQTLVAGEHAGNGLVTITTPVPTEVIGGKRVDTTDKTAVMPFAGIEVADPNPGSLTDYLAVALGSGANGTLSDPNEATDGGAFYNGTYQLAGDPAALTAALDGLVFTPTQHQVAPGGTVTTTVTIEVLDSIGANVEDTSVSIVAAAVASPITVAPATQTHAALDVQSVPPLLGIQITDPNFGQTETASVQFNPSNGVLTDTQAATDGSIGGNGTYTVTGSAIDVGSLLNGLTFTPTQHQVAPGSTVTTDFNVSITDTAGETAVASSTLIAKAVTSQITITATPTGVSTTDEQAAHPLSGVVIDDPNFGQTETAVVHFDSSQGTLVDPNSAADGSTLNGGSLTITSGDVTSLESILDGLVFTPKPHLVAPGSTRDTPVQVTLTDTVGERAIANVNVTVTAIATAIAATPVITGVTTTDMAPVSPFSGVDILDPNLGQTETAVVTLNTSANGTLSDPHAASDHSVNNNGTLTVSGTALAVQDDLDGLRFTPQPGEVPVGSSVQTAVTATITDTAGETTAISSTVTADAVVCFLRGTRIATPAGERGIEDLVPGDLVLTAGGQARPVRWIGRGTVSTGFRSLNQRSEASPVIVRRNALADGVPHRDLRITKAHGLYIDGVLIPAEFLINHRSILWDDHAREVTLYHIELETHDVLLANGAPAESYRDDGNRWLFRNASTGRGLPPQRPFAPVLTGGAMVDSIWRRLLDRAGSRSAMPLTKDPDLHLLVDGQRLAATSRHGMWHTFQLAAGPSTVRLASRSGVPQEMGTARDPRSLGVAVRQIMVTQGRQVRTVEAEDKRLVKGFHGFEANDAIRWTDGDAEVPPCLFEGIVGPLQLIVRLGGETNYLDEGCERQVA